MLNNTFGYRLSGKRHTSSRKISGSPTPLDGKTTISLQTCTLIPTFENRLVVRGELVS